MLGISFWHCSVVLFAVCVDAYLKPAWVVSCHRRPGAAPTPKDGVSMSIAGLETETPSTHRASINNTTGVKELKHLPHHAGWQFLYHAFRGQHHKFMYEMMKKYGENYIIWGKYAVLNSPAAIRDVLETYNLPKTPATRKGYQSIFYKRGGILAAPWRRWKKQRRILAPAMSERAMGKLAPHLEACSRPMLAYLDSNLGLETEIDEVFMAYTIDVIGSTMFGRSFQMCELLGNATGIPIAKALNSLTDEALAQIVLPPWVLKLRLPSQNLQKARKLVDSFLDQCIALRVETKDPKRDLLGILLDAEASGTMDRDDVKGQLLTFLFAGHDTTAHSLSYMLWEISRNASLQSELAAEAESLLPDSEDSPLETELLAKQLPLLDRTFSETLRKHPSAAAGSTRWTGPRSYVVDDSVEIPAYTSITMPPYSLHRNEKYWSNPERFDPSRWEAPLPEPWAFLPFSGGPRNCVGSTIARAEALFIMAMLLRRYHIRCNDMEEPSDSLTLTRKPAKGIKFLLTERKDARSD